MVMSKPVKRKNMRHHLKHWFVPHKQNDHRPHLIRIHGLAVIALLVVGVQITANMMRPPSVRVLAYASNITPVDLLSETNQQRLSHGIPALRLDARLNQSATLKAGNMFSENYWAHVSPSGIQPWYWFQKAGYSYSYAGENLAMDFDTTDGTMQGWMNSPGHRANILNPSYTDVGFAVQNGTLVGGQTTLVVAHYGSQVNSSVAAAAPAPSPPKAAPRVVALASTPQPIQAAATPAPVPSISATLSPRPVVASINRQTSSAPSPQKYSLFKPLSLVGTLNTGTIVTIGLLAILLVVYIYTHMTVWRKGLKRWETVHYRLFAGAQIASLSIAIITLSVSGLGSVG
jgi:hypothetical protein